MGSQCRKLKESKESTQHLRAAQVSNWANLGCEEGTEAGEGRTWQILLQAKGKKKKPAQLLAEKLSSLFLTLLFGIGAAISSAISFKSGLSGKAEIKNSIPLVLLAFVGSQNSGEVAKEA